MPTLTWLDSFEHQNAASTYYGTNAGVWDTGPSSAFALWSFVTGRRTGSHALQIAQNGTTAARAGKVVAAGNRVLVESFYFKCSAKPSVDSSLWAATGAVSNSSLQIASATGFLAIRAVAAGSVTNGNVDVTDGQWHRIDLKLDSSANPYKLDVSLDGVAQTQNSSGAVAGDINSAGLGTIASAHTLTADYADWVRSVTGGDHPIGDHICVPLIVNADGAHNWSGSHFANEVGVQSSSISTLWQSVDDWPATAGDYIEAGTTALSTEYAEILLPDVGSGATVWAARAIAVLHSQATTANSATTRIVDGSGTTVLDLYVGDQSDTGFRHQASLLPGVDTPSEVNALKWRVGFPTDSNPVPRWGALMVDIALPGATGDGTASPAAVAGVGAVPAPTAKGNATASPGAVAGIGSVPAPTADGGVTNGTALPGAVAGIGAVPAPTATGSATATPAAVAGLGTVPAPAATGTAIASPSSVAGVGAVPPPTAQGNATATPGAVAGVGSVPAPSAFTSNTALPATVAGVGTVPTPTATGSATATPGAVAGIGSVPPPTATGVGNATANPAAVAGIGSVPAVTASGTAKASPSAVAGIGSVPAPTASGGAGATASPAAVAGVGTVPAPTAAGVAAAPPATVAGIGSAPAPTLHGNATATPGTVAGIGDVPAPTATSIVPGIAHPDEVAGVGAVPAPVALVAAFAHPAVVAAVGAVPTPTGRGDATAYPLGSCNGDEFTDDFTDDFGGFGPFSTEFSIEFDDVGSCFGPVAGIGAVPAPNAHGQGPPQQQHDFDPGRTSPRLVARARAGWSARPKEPALAGRANPEGGG